MYERSSIVTAAQALGCSVNLSHFGCMYFHDKRRIHLFSTVACVIGAVQSVFAPRTAAWSAVKGISLYLLPLNMERIILRTPDCPWRIVAFRNLEDCGVQLRIFFTTWKVALVDWPKLGIFLVAPHGNNEGQRMQAMQCDRIRTLSHAFPYSFDPFQGLVQVFSHCIKNE